MAEITEKKSESAYVMITCLSGSESTVVESLRSTEGLKRLEQTMGNYDIILKIEAESAVRLSEIITEKIRKTSGIRATTTLMCTIFASPLILQSLR